MQKISKLFMGLVLAFGGTFGVFVAMALPPGAWGTIVTTAVIGTFLLLALIVVGWIITRLLSHNEYNMQTMAGVISRQQEGHNQTVAQFAGVMHHALTAMEASYLTDRIAAGVRLYQLDNGRLVLDIPGQGEIDAIRDAKMTQPQIDYFVEAQRPYLLN